MKGRKKNKQDKKGNLECKFNSPNSPKPKTFQRNLPKQAHKCPSESTTETLGFSRPTRPDEPYHTQARSHLAQA